ncbi:MAG: 50S ribosomal protein L14e [Candidatus Woesearchaeota archaeon]
MIEIGRLCVKTAGRDAGKKCVIVDILDDKFVLIDGETRRRKCNIFHLEALDQIVALKKGASHEEVADALKTIGIEARKTKTKAKTVRPRTLRRSKLATQQTAEISSKKIEKPKTPAKKQTMPREAKPKKTSIKKPVEKKAE